MNTGAELDGRPIVGVEINKDVSVFKLLLKMYFDKETGLLVKQEETLSRASPGSTAVPTLAAKRRSSAVTGVPSCQRAPDRMRHVISMRPSGNSFQRPFSRLGTAWPSWGGSVP